MTTYLDELLKHMQGKHPQKAHAGGRGASGKGEKVIVGGFDVTKLAPDRQKLFPPKFAKNDLVTVDFGPRGGGIVKGAQVLKVLTDLSGDAIDPIKYRLHTGKTTVNVTPERILEKTGEADFG